MALGTVEIFHAITFHGKFNIVSLFVMFETNASESSQFLQTYFIAKVAAVLGAFIAGALFVWRMIAAHGVVKRTPLVFGCYVLFLPFVVKSNIDSAENGPAIGHGQTANAGAYVFAGPFADVLAAAADYHAQIVAYREEAAKRKGPSFDVKANSKSVGQSQIYVLVMGESTNRNYMHIATNS